MHLCSFFHSRADRSLYMKLHRRTKLFSDFYCNSPLRLSSTYRLYDRSLDGHYPALKLRFTRSAHTNAY